MIRVETCFVAASGRHEMHNEWQRWAVNLTRMDAERAAEALIERMGRLQDVNTLRRLNTACVRQSNANQKPEVQNARRTALHPIISALSTAIEESERQRRTSRGGMVRVDDRVSDSAAVRTRRNGGQS